MGWKMRASEKGGEEEEKHRPFHCVDITKLLLTFLLKPFIRYCSGAVDRKGVHCWGTVEQFIIHSKLISGQIYAASTSEERQEKPTIWECRIYSMYSSNTGIRSQSLSQSTYLANCELTGGHSKWFEAGAIETIMTGIVSSSPRTPTYLLLCVLVITISSQGSGNIT